MCGKTPKPDPAIGRAAEANAEIARQSFELAKQQFEFEKQQWEKLAPSYEEMFKGALQDSKDARERSQFSWDRYLQKGVPLEDQVIRDAQSYDSPEETARREGMAAATVQGQIDAQQRDTTMELGRMGVSAARAGQQLTSDRNAAALAKAGAVNQERTNSKLTGMALRGDAVNITRGLPSQSMGLTQLTNQSAAAAQGAAGAGQGFRAGGMGMYSQGAGLAVGANNSAANIYSNLYQQQMAGSNAKWGAIGSLAGMGLSMFTGGAKPWIFGK